MKIFHVFCFMLFSSMVILPAYVSAADNVNSKLNNQSAHNGSKGFYLVQEKVLGEGDCAKVQGNKRLNPGDSAELSIKKDCSWGVVRYKIFNVKDNKEMGYLGHSFHDGNFSIEINSTCNGSECNFYDLSPDQDRKK